MLGAGGAFMERWRGPYCSSWSRKSRVDCQLIVIDDTEASSWQFASPGLLNSERSYVEVSHDVCITDVRASVSGWIALSFAVSDWPRRSLTTCPHQVTGKGLNKIEGAGLVGPGEEAL